MISGQTVFYFKRPPLSSAWPVWMRIEFDVYSLFKHTLLFLADVDVKPVVGWRQFWSGKGTDAQWWWPNSATCEPLWSRVCCGCHISEEKCLWKMLNCFTWHLEWDNSRQVSGVQLPCWQEVQAKGNVTLQFLWNTEHFKGQYQGKVRLFIRADWKICYKVIGGGHELWLVDARSWKGCQV